MILPTTPRSPGLYPSPLLTLSVESWGCQGPGFLPSCCTENESETKRSGRFLSHLISQNIIPMVILYHRLFSCRGSECIDLIFVSFTLLYYQSIQDSHWNHHRRRVRPEPWYLRCIYQTSTSHRNFRLGNSSPTSSVLTYGTSLLH